MENRWTELLKMRSFWTGVAMVAVPVVNALTGRALDQTEVAAVLVGLGAILVKLLFDDALAAK
jgi:hypothetical protein